METMGGFVQDRPCPCNCNDIVIPLSIRNTYHNCRKWIKHISCFHVSFAIFLLSNLNCQLQFRISCNHSVLPVQLPYAPGSAVSYVKQRLSDQMLRPLAPYGTQSCHFLTSITIIEKLCRLLNNIGKHKEYAGNTMTATLADHKRNQTLFDFCSSSLSVDLILQHQS